MHSSEASSFVLSMQNVIVSVLLLYFRSPQLPCKKEVVDGRRRQLLSTNKLCSVSAQSSTLCFPNVGPVALVCSVQALLEQDVFHRSLLACCLEIVLFAYSSPRTFPWIIEVLDIRPFYFYKVNKHWLRTALLLKMACYWIKSRRVLPWESGKTRTGIKCALGYHYRTQIARCGHAALSG